MMRLLGRDNMKKISSNSYYFKIGDLIQIKDIDFENGIKFIYKIEKGVGNSIPVNHYYVFPKIKTKHYNIFDYFASNSLLNIILIKMGESND